MYKQISFNFKKNKITRKLFTYKSFMYIYLTAASKRLIINQMFNVTEQYMKTINCGQTNDEY